MAAVSAPPIAHPVRRVVIYARVSKISRADRTRGDAKSVAQQLDVLCGLAVREGVQVVAVFRDDGISASSFAHGTVREGWVQTMEVITSGQVDELWVWEVSRATRDRAVYAALIGACTVQDVKITVNGRVHDPNDPDDAFMLDLGAALAVKESALTSKRIRRDVAARAAQGRPHGRIPYGYQREYDPHTGALLRQVPDPATAPIVRELARRVLAGEALYRLAAELNARGVPSPETVRRRRQGDMESTWDWRPDQVRDVVASPAAAGLRAHQGRVLRDVTASWEPIISPTTTRCSRPSSPTLPGGPGPTRPPSTCSPGSPAVGSAAGRSGASPTAAAPATPVSAAATSTPQAPVGSACPVGWTTSTPSSPT